MSGYATDVLLDTRTVFLRDVRCAGECRHKTPEECVSASHLVFPYRGVFVRHVGRHDTVAEANQVVMFNAEEGYAISHPVDGGDACLSLSLSEELLAELAPREEVRVSGPLAFHHRSRRMDPRAQALVALLRHRLRSGAADTLEGESLTLALVGSALGERTPLPPAASFGRQKLVNRAKLVLASDPGRRWTLAEIAAEVGGVSPVYLTQVFREVEGMPLYRYQLRLRLARALQLLPRCEDLTTLALDLGFSSHSHFSAVFRQTYGRPPAEFRRTATLEPAAD